MKKSKKTTLSSGSKKSAEITEEEMNTIKTIADYLFMDQYQDTCGFPRFEECFGVFCLSQKIDLPVVFKTICGKRKKYITFRRLIAIYKQWKSNPQKLPKDFQNFMTLVFQNLLKKSETLVGPEVEHCIYYNTRNCINRYAISKFTVITDEDKTTIKGFRIYYDDMFKNDLFLNKETEKYYVTLEINLVPDNTSTTPDAQQSFPTQNDRDGITHLGGTYDDKAGITCLIFKCRSGKTCFIGKPLGKSFLYGSYKKQLKTIKAGVRDGILMNIEPFFDSIERFNPNLDKTVKDITDDFLKEDKPIYEETILVNVGEEEADKNALQPLVSDERFFNKSKFQDKIGGFKFSDICPIVNQFFQKDPKTNKTKFNFSLNGLLEEAGKFSQVRQERVDKLKSIAGGQGDQPSGGLLGKISNIIPADKKGMLSSVGDFLQNSGNFDSLLGKVGNIIGKDLGNTSGGGIGGLISGAVSGLGGLFGVKQQSQEPQPPENQVPAEGQQLRARKTGTKGANTNIGDNLKGSSRLKAGGFGGFGDMFNTFNNIAGSFGFSSPFSSGGRRGGGSIFDPFGFSGFSGSSSSSVYIFDDGSYQREQEQRKRQQEEIKRRQEEEEAKRYNEEQRRKLMQKAQEKWMNFYDRYSQIQGVFIIQTIGAVIRALTILRKEENGIPSGYSVEEKIRLFKILQANRNVVMMLNKAHKEALRREEEERKLQIDKEKMEEMKKEEERREKEEKKRIEEEKKIREKEKNISQQQYQMEQEKKKREQEIKNLIQKIQEERNAQKRRELLIEQEKKEQEDKRKKQEEIRKQKELEEKKRKVEEERKKQEEKKRKEEEEKKRKQEEIKRKAEEEAKKREEEERKAIAAIQEKQTLSADDLPMINEKLAQIENLIQNAGLPAESKKKLQEYYNELLRQKNAIIDALNKKEKEKIAEQMAFDAEEAKKKDEEERKRLKEEEDKKIEKKRQEEEAKKKEKTKVISISNLEIPEGTKIWRNQKMGEAGKIFSDDTFPPVRKSLCPVSSIGRWEFPEDITQEDVDGWEDFTWERAENIFGSKNYQVFFEGVKKEDIIQGGLGDCYFLSAVAALCKFPKLIERLFFFKEKSNEHCYACYFRVNGIWKLVVVDDYIPCYGNWGKNFAFSSTNGNELWVIILEKAWAKLNGNYAKAIGGEPQEVFDVITNAYSEKIRVKSGQEEKLWEKFSFAEKNGFIMTAGTSGDTYNLDIEEVGLVPGHAYTVLGVKTVKSGSSQVKLVHIRNPWGNGEWSGDWSDSSRKWTAELKKECDQTANKNDGSFWMTFQDFCRYYVVVGICHLYENFLYSVLHVEKKITQQGPLLSRVEVYENNTKCYLTLHQKNPRIILKDKTYQKSVVCYLMLIDEKCNYIAANNNSDSSCTIETTLNKGNYYLITDINFRYVQNVQHCYNLSSYASSAVGIFPETDKNIEELFKNGLYSYAQKNLSPQSHQGGKLYQSKKSESEFSFSFIIFDNTGNYDVTLSDSLSFRGGRNADFYFEGKKNSSTSLSKTVQPNQWDIFCHMPYSFGSMYSYGLQSQARSHSGQKPQKGLASLSGGNAPTIQSQGGSGSNNSNSGNKGNSGDDEYDAVFREEGEALDNAGTIKQYVHQGSGCYYLGLENTSKRSINLKLVLTGLYEINNPNKSSIPFTSKSGSRNVFVVKPKSGAKDISFMFSQG